MECNKFQTHRASELVVTDLQQLHFPNTLTDAQLHWKVLGWAEGRCSGVWSQAALGLGWPQEPQQARAGGCWLHPGPNRPFPTLLVLGWQCCNFSHPRILSPALPSAPQPLPPPCPCPSVPPGEGGLSPTAARTASATEKVTLQWGGTDCSCCQCS